MNQFINKKINYQYKIKNLAIIYWIDYQFSYLKLKKNSIEDRIIVCVWCNMSLELRSFWKHVSWAGSSRFHIDCGCVYRLIYHQKVLFKLL